MARSKYRFNPESLSFDRIGLSFKVLIIKFFTYFFAGIVISVAFNFAFSYFFDSPKERIQKREIEQMKLQYEILQKKLNQASTVLDDLRQRDDNLYRTIFEAEPIPRSVREAGFGGVNRYDDLEGYENSNLIIETSKKLDKILKQVYVQSKSYDQVIPMALNKEQMLKCIPAIQPVANKGLERTSSGFGWRIHPWYKIKIMHSGFDFAAPIGTEIYATGDGVVEKCESSYRGYGNNIVIDHGFGYKTLYGHMSAFKVSPGQKVKRGDIIGLVGNTGLSTGPHVHYEVIKNNEKNNPANYFFNDLSPEQYDQITAISNNVGQALD
jgi:murein DD-endopeptidase MepM/ murein hydrolase activator NlpD